MSRLAGGLAGRLASAGAGGRFREVWADAAISPSGKSPSVARTIERNKKEEGGTACIDPVLCKNGSNGE
jgi:hypothetical protein